jgi:hypothetical protein
MVPASRASKLVYSLILGFNALENARKMRNGKELHGLITDVSRTSDSRVAHDSSKYGRRFISIEACHSTLLHSVAVGGKPMTPLQRCKKGTLCPGLSLAGIDL